MQIGYLNDTETKDVPEYEAKLFDVLRNKYSDWLDRIRNGYWDDSDINTLKEALEGLRR